MTEETPVADASTRVFVMRHGQSEGNVARIWTSARTGFPLTPLGHEQARTAAALLSDRGIAAVYGSPLVRAQETAADVAEVLDVPCGVIEGVEELHAGVHEGQHDDEVAPVAMEVFSRWLGEGDFDHGFENGETGRQVADRFASALNQVADQHSGDSIVVVSHGGAIALGVGALCANVPPGFIGEHLLANTEVVEVVRANGEWVCERWAGLPPN